MRVAIHHSAQIHRDSFSHKWIEYFKVYGVKVLPMDFYGLDVVRQVSESDAALWHFFHNPDDMQVAKAVLNAIDEGLNIPVWPNRSTRWHFDNKIGQHYLLESLNTSYVSSWVFWTEIEARKFIEKCCYPIVLKLKSGAGSANVVLIENKKEASIFIQRLFHNGVFPYTFNEFERGEVEGGVKHRFKLAYNLLLRKKFPPLPSQYWEPERNYVFFQKYLSGNEFDTRVTVIGNRAFGFRRFNRKNDFRASGSGRIDHDAHKIDLRCVEIAFDISKRCGFQSMAYDFLFEENTPKLIEISYGYADWAVHDCPGHWDDKLDWCEGQMWPQEAHVIDFIKEIE